MIATGNSSAVELQLAPAGDDPGALPINKVQGRIIRQTILPWRQGDQQPQQLEVLLLAPQRPLSGLAGPSSDWRLPAMLGDQRRGLCLAVQLSAITGIAVIDGRNPRQWSKRFLTAIGQQIDSAPAPQPGNSYWLAEGWGPAKLVSTLNTEPRVSRDNIGVRLENCSWNAEINVTIKDCYWLTA